MKLKKYNQNGMGLMEVIIAAGLMSILALALASMFQSQSKETRALGEKLSSYDFTRLVTSTLSKPTTCSANFANANVVGGTAALTNLDLTNAATTPVIVNLSSLSGVILGGAISATSKTAVINATAGIQVQITGPLTANLVVNLDTTKLVRPISGLTFPLNLNSSGAVNSTTVTGCASATGTGIGEGGQTWQDMTGLRGNGGTYTNNTGKPIMVAVSGSCGGASGAWFYINGANVGFGMAQWNGCGAYPFTGPWIVPDGATYSATVMNGLRTWFELR